MRVRKRRRKGDGEEIPVSSFSDIAFLLIIFFILTTTLEKPTAFIADIPSGEKGEAQEGQKPTVAMNDAELRFNDAPITVERLKTELLNMDLADRDPDDRVIIIETSGQVRYQDYFKVMSVIAGSGGLVAIVREGEKSE
ncbi:MAG: biopolymer transporter ExbD [Lentisphaerae bacterium]|jgi:biopolymer transport protein ExbD|nr:biopolymer transporter ExbD [Lentisphaerota bacterium]